MLIYNYGNIELLTKIKIKRVSEKELCELMQKEGKVEEPTVKAVQ